MSTVTTHTSDGREVAPQANLSWAHLRGANLHLANLSGADLSWANLSGADLSGANLRGANLRGANMSRADLRGANMSWANLSGADLSEANLYLANMSWANLREADLSEANMRGANMSRANLSEANGIRWASVSWAGHGECGRMLTAVHNQDGHGHTVYHCGCFRGSRTALKWYIRQGDSRLRASRLRAMGIVDGLLLDGGWR